MSPDAPTLDQLVRSLLRDVVREVVREELAAAPLARALPAPVPVEPPRMYLTPKDVAALLSVTEKSVRAWVAKGTLRAVRLGSLIRVERGELDRFLVDAGNANSPDVDSVVTSILSRRRG